MEPEAVISPLDTGRSAKPASSATPLLRPGDKLRIHLPDEGGIELVLSLPSVPCLSTLRLLAESQTFLDLGSGPINFLADCRID